MNGKLYLIPTTLGNSSIDAVIPRGISEIINSIRYYIVENERTARRYLLKIGIRTKIDDLTFFVLNKHTKPTDLEKFLLPVGKGNAVGIISEAGCPGIADPGAEIVEIAHRKNIQVVPLVGPSSVFLSLMASGMNGQNFAFTGYVPIKQNERKKTIKRLEKNVYAENQTQIFIEAPYRNMQLLKELLNTCQNKTKLCIATDITLESEFVRTQSIEKWKKKLPELHKRPTIFLLGK